jgi:hypothetical protein
MPAHSGCFFRTTLRLASSTSSSPPPLASRSSRHLLYSYSTRTTEHTSRFRVNRVLWLLRTLPTRKLRSYLSTPHKEHHNQDQMCTAAENHCPSCCMNHGGVYSQPCPVLYQLRPNQHGYVQINHTINKRNPTMVLETCGKCKRREQKRSWLKDKWVSSSRIKASKHIPCEICQNYQEERDQPLEIIPLF